MIGRVMSRRPAAVRALPRLQYREAILIAIVMAVVAAVGWLVTPFWLAVAIAAQLAIGGIGAVWLIGPVRPELGFARYATLATAGVALTLFGRLLVPSIGLLLTPVVALLLFGVIRLELGLTEAGQRRVGLDLALVGIVFAAAAGIGGMIPADAWPPGLILLLILAACPRCGAAEARGRSGVEAVGQAALHLVAVAQLATAVALLHLPGVVGAAIVALGLPRLGRRGRGAGRRRLRAVGDPRVRRAGGAGPGGGAAPVRRLSAAPAARLPAARGTRVDTPCGRCYNKAPSGRNGPLRTCHRPFSTTISRGDTHR